MRQSATQSVWRAAVKCSPIANAPPIRPARADFVAISESPAVLVQGTNWQEVVFDIPNVRQKGARFMPPYTGVRIGSQTAGNRVEIDWVDVSSMQVPVQARKSLVVPAGVRWAKISVSAQGDYRFYVNGQPALDHFPGVSLDQLWNYELDPSLFTVGTNVLAIECPGRGITGGRFLLDGALLCEDGAYLRFDSDASWKGRAAAADDGWRMPAYDDAVWPAAYVYDDSHVRDIFKPWFNPSYKGLLDVRPADNRREPVFGSRESVALRVQVPVMGRIPPVVSYRIFDEMGDLFHARDAQITEGTVPMHLSGADWQGELAWRAGDLPPNRAYAVEFAMQAGEIADARRYELAVCGPVKMPEVSNPQTYTEGMNLKLVWETHAADEQPPDKFFVCDFKGQPAEADVVENRLGRWRVGKKHRQVLSFKYAIPNPGRPHVAIAEYPADTARCQTMRLEDALPDLAIVGRLRAGMPIMQLGNDGALLGGFNPLTATVNEHRVLFFPNQSAGMVSFMDYGNYSSSLNQADAARLARVAVGHIRIYEVLNDIPAKAMNDAPGQRRRIGQQTERGPSQLLQSNFQSPIAPYFKVVQTTEAPGFYRNWLVTFINLVKRMRFDGTDTQYLGQFMYSGVLHPSRYSYACNLSGGSPGSMKDYGGLLSKIFEENDMRWYSALEMIGLPCFQPQYDDEAVRRGADTLAQVSKDGQQLYAWSFSRIPTLMPNWIRPEVRREFEAYIDELLSLYGGQRGWQGIFLQVNEILGPCWNAVGDPYNASYDDYTMRIFESETGIAVPVDAGDAERFARRYQWLMDNAREVWTDWRCRKLQEIYLVAATPAPIPPGFGIDCLSAGNVIHGAALAH